MSKWDSVKPKRAKEKRIKEDPLCRVIPPMLARIPNIDEWLFKSRNIKMSSMVALDLKKAYKVIIELIEYNSRKDKF